jgi:putative glutamine amidotransferase
VNYFQAVERAGGLPILIPASEDVSLAERYIGLLDGLLLIGGADINAETYGAKQHVLSSSLPKVKEIFDIELVRAALRRDIPVFGICLSCQLVNVALGGTLYQDVVESFPDSQLRHRRLLSKTITNHRVKIEAGSKLHKIIGRDEIETNSSHHQSVKGLGKGLRAVAFAEDGVVEAVESTEQDFVVTVQWHPEYLADREEHFNLFKALVNAAAARRS